MAAEAQVGSDARRLTWRAWWHRDSMVKWMVALRLIALKILKVLCHLELVVVYMSWVLGGMGWR